MKKLKLFLSALLLSVSSLGVFIAPHAFAATKTWTGGGSDTKMTTAGNWTGGAPTAGDDLVFPVNITNRTVDNDFTALTSFNSITFSGTATQDSNYTMTGLSMTLVAGITNTMTGSFNTSQSIGFDLKLSGTQTIDPGVDVSGAINLNGSALTVNTGAGFTSLSGVISGTGSITQTGTGYLILSGTNTFDAAITVSGGELVVASAAGLGSATGGTTVSSGASLYIYQPNTDTTFAEPLNLSGDGVGAFQPTLMLATSFQSGGIVTPPYKTYTLSGAVTLGSNITVGVGARNGKLTGAITGSHAINLMGTSEGTFEIASSSNGSSTANQVLSTPVKETKYEDDQASTAINVSSNETAIVTGKRGITTVNVGGTLKGTGTVGDLTSFGTVAPGMSPGCLSTGNLVLLSGTYQAEIGGKTACTQYDQLKVTGTVQVGGALDVSLYNNFKPVVGQKYVIISNDGSDDVSGTFDGLSEGATVTLGAYKFSITYKGGDGNDVQLTVTTGAPDTGFSLISNSPFVTTAVMLAAAGGIAFMARRSMRTATVRSKR